jgi:Secretion system C-terminal sorting domain
MKKIYFFSLHLFAFVSVFLLANNPILAHFGSKGPYGGSVNCAMVYDSTVYIGTTNGGVYRSSNSNLTSWTAMPVGLKNSKITALAHSGSYLVAGTLDSGVYIFNGFVGTDRHWVKINQGLTNLKILSLVALDSISFLAGTDGGGLFKTTNKGVTWTDVAWSDYAVTALVKVGNRLLGTRSVGGVYISNDNGENWTSFNDANTLNISGTIALSHNATTDELAVINRNGIFILSNASTTTTPTYAAASMGLTAGTVLRSVATNGTNWYLATDKGAFVSPTGTINWATANSGLQTQDVKVVVPFRTSLILGTNKGGMYKSATNPIAWTAHNTGYNNLETYAMETSGATVVVAATEKGVFVSTDLAATYNRANNGLTDSLNVTYLKFLGNVLYAGTKNAGIFMSTDTGKTWSTANAGLTNLNIKKIFASASNLYVLDANNNLFQAIGWSWSPIQTGLPANVIPTSMTFYGSKMLLGTLGQGVFTREVLNGTWTALNTGLTNLKVTSVTTNGTKIFAGTDGSGVFVADIATVGWKQATLLTISHTVLMGLDGTKIQEMAFYNGYIFASYKGGLLATSDNGATWIAGGNQFNLPSYSNINTIAFVTTRVFVATENNGLYSNALSELPVIVSKSDDINNNLNELLIISPNPNEGHFNIQLKEMASEVKSIILYDNIGKAMQIIYNFNGLDKIDLAVNYPAGIYFVRVNTDKGVAVKKIVIQ